VPDAAPEAVYSLQVMQGTQVTVEAEAVRVDQIPAARYAVVASSTLAVDRLLARATMTTPKLRLSPVFT
jgi:hypothetical protein